MTRADRRPVFRFAPSPNGFLHLGHAYSALCNERAALRTGGDLLLRIEDIDLSRARPEFEAAIVEDLGWLGVTFAPAPRRQSQHFHDYREALRSLAARGLIYACRCSRAVVLSRGGGARDPSGSPLHVSPCASGPADLDDLGATWRLDTRCALDETGELAFLEFGEGDEPRRIAARPENWGDPMLAGRGKPASYHLAVVVDDALQGVTDIVRGRDRIAQTSIHVLLQALLGLPTPRYRHHRLVLDDQNAKLSKSLSSQSLREIRSNGASAADVRASLGFSAEGGRPLRATIA